MTPEIKNRSPFGLIFIFKQLYLFNKSSSLTRIIFTVTNDLNYDQRMQRIAGSLQSEGYAVLLVGRKKKDSPELAETSYHQKRLSCFFNRGWVFYLEYQIRLFGYLFFQKADILCAIDLDTILPVYFVSILRKRKRVYDAHELFTEQKEVLSRPMIQRIWRWVEEFAVPRFPRGYTVNETIARELQHRYGVHYEVIRNLPRLTQIPENKKDKEKWIIYQGSVNEGRCFEQLIPAMKQVQARLVICGEGNFFEQTMTLVKKNGLKDKVSFTGYLSPAELVQKTPEAYIGITLFEKEGMNQYFSLANRFFDYCMAGIPQICVNYPEYAAIYARFQIASLIEDTEPDTIARSLNNLLCNDVLYEQIRTACLKARLEFNWEKEVQTLINFYRNF